MSALSLLLYARWLQTTDLGTCTVITPTTLRTDVAETLCFYLDARYGVPTVEKHIKESFSRKESFRFLSLLP